MNNIIEKFAEGRKIIKRIYLEDMERTWIECVEKYGLEWQQKNKKENWIIAIKRPTWSYNTIWNEEENCWIEFEDWMDSQL